MSLLLVTKPFAPPWHDSSSGLARSLVHGLIDAGDGPDVRVMVGDVPSGFAGITEERTYGPSADFAPGLRQNLPVLMRLFRHRGERVRHFFFAPNPRTAFAARFAARVRPVPSVHTLCSLPAEGVAIRPSLFAQRSVVVSPWAQRRLAAEGVEVPCIEPAVLPLSTTAEGQAHCRETYGDYLLFAGDLRPQGGVWRALNVLKALDASLRLVIACRDKTEADRGRRQQLLAQIEALGLTQRVDVLGQIDWLGDLVAAARLQLFLATDLTGKMDYPLVLLEGFAAGVPSVVAAEAPMADVQHAALGVASPDDVADVVRVVEQTLGVASADARALYQARFAPPRLARAYRSLYDALAEPS